MNNPEDTIHFITVFNEIVENLFLKINMNNDDDIERWNTAIVSIPSCSFLHVDINI